MQGSFPSLRDNFSRIGISKLRDWLNKEFLPITRLGRVRPWQYYSPGDETAAATAARMACDDHARFSAHAAFASVYEALTAIDDPRDAAARIQAECADATDIFRIAIFANTVETLRKSFDFADGGPALNRMALDEIRGFLAPHCQPHGFLIAPHTDAEVAAAATAYAACDKHCTTLRAARYEALQAAGITVRQPDRQIMLRADVERLMHGAITEKIRIIEDTSAFLIWDIRVDGELAAAQAECLTALAAYDAANARALESIMGRLKPYVAAILALADWVAACDHRYVRAAFIERHGPPFCIPELADTAEFMLMQGRYLALERATGAAYVPVDLTGHKPILITGMHMGGKTSALLACATAAALMQIGMPVPAQAARLRLYESVTLLPPPENSYPGWSAFGVEMRGVQALCAAEKQGARLVLCDEFARSTNAAEGRALAIAFMRYMQRRGDDLIAVTHLDGIAAAVPAERYQAGGDYTDTHKQMDYRLRRVADDAPTGSHALATARAAGVPLEIIAEAAALLGSQAAL